MIKWKGGNYEEEETTRQNREAESGMLDSESNGNNFVLLSRQGFSPNGEYEYYSTSDVDEDLYKIKHNKLSIVSTGVSGIENETRPILPEKAFYLQPLFWVALITFTLIGGGCPIVSKLGVTTETFPCPESQTCQPQMFQGYLGISFLKFFWQTINSLLIYKVLDYKVLKEPFFSKKEDYLASKKYGKGIYARFLITAALETAFTICDRAATIYVRTSIVTAVASLQILFSTLGDLTINRRAFMVQELIGFIVLIGGLGLYIYEMMTISEDGDGQNVNTTLGITLSAVACAGRGFHASYQGRLMHKYRFPALKALFLDSALSMVYVLILTAVLNTAGMVDSYEEFWMIFRSWRVQLSVQLFGFMCIGVNGGSAVLGKYVSSVYRIILFRLPAFVTWILELCIGWTMFDWLVLTGYIIIFLATIIFAGALPKALRFKWLSRPWLCGCLYPSARATLSDKQLMEYGHDIKTLPF